MINVHLSDDLRYYYH